MAVVVDGFSEEIVGMEVVVMVPFSVVIDSKLKSCSASEDSPPVGKNGGGMLVAVVTASFNLNSGSEEDGLGGGMCRSTR